MNWSTWRIKCDTLFHSPICYRSCWDRTPECLVGCKAWCLLRLARYERQEGPTWIWELQLEILCYRSQGETESPQKTAKNWYWIKRLTKGVTSAWRHILHHLMRRKEEGDMLIVKTSLSLLTATSCRDFLFSGTMLHSFFKVYININIHVFFRTSEKKLRLGVCSLKNTSFCADLSYLVS